MLPKELRLLSHEISTIKRHGKTLSRDGILLCYIPSSDNQSRFSFIVTKRTSKKAVIRNTIKRQLRTFTRTHYNTLIQQYSVVIIVKHLKSDKKEALFDVLSTMFNEL